MISRRRFLELSCCTAIAGDLLPGDAADISFYGRQPEVQLEAARGVLTRLLGSRSGNFDLQLIAAEGTQPVARISAFGGRVSIRASSGVALCRAAYTYLRQECSAMVTWSGEHLHLPASFPSVAEYTISCPYRFVQYYNPCTFGYSTPFWNWQRWERELDWMALHGITMPLAMDGQEAIWQTVWKSFGLTQAELDHFSVGPAHLPWHRMGNINDFDGPLPQSWVDGKRDLQTKILGRMRSLGMTPVAPAFSGFVPEGFKRVNPGARTSTVLWGDGAYVTMPRETKTFILHPGETELYKQIGKAFIQEYKRVFGPVDYYLADTFNELAAPVGVQTRYQDLAAFGRTVYEGIIAGDPNGTWVMQGWLFADDPKFWDSPSVEALLSKVPDDRMIILDYTNDADPKRQTRFPSGQWKRHQAFYGKQWVNGMAHTFGGNNNVKGNLAMISSEPFDVLENPAHGRLVGWSMDPEGIESNEVVYELMTDIGWTEKRIQLRQWISSYCQARYGAVPIEMKSAWDLLLQSAYSSHTWMTKHRWQVRPSLEPEGDYKRVSLNSVDSSPVFTRAVEQFLSCYDSFHSNVLYRNDLIEFVSQSVGGSVERMLQAACDAHKAGHPEERDQKAKAALDMLLRVDALMNLRSDRRLETWVHDARSWAAGDDEAAYYDQNARRIITYWGWSELADYAARVWSGLIRDYYVPRWTIFFAELKQNSPSTLNVWEETWLSSPYKPSVPLSVPNLDREARSMLNTCRSWNI
ncbi:MAG TPA: alpha-N-acetylglucosaminidase [Terracidiphilus sp.]